MREKTRMKVLGTHFLLELWNCNVVKANDPDYLQAVLSETANILGAVVLKTLFQQFSPQGVSGVVLISQSHISIHTWPEHGYAAVDIFSCGNESGLWKAAKYIEVKLEAVTANTQDFKRGIPDTEGQQFQRGPCYPKPKGS
jgi:S-adenosylmethionine decarboxylase